MRKLLLLSLLILLNLCVYAQKEVFRIDSIPKEGILLNKGWKFHAGDNPDFAKPDFDDSKWESIDPTKDVMDLKQFGKQNIGWFRLTFKVDSSLLGQTFALSVRQVGSSQIFNNSSLITQIGEFSSKTTVSKGYDPSGTPFRITFNNKNLQTIIVKFEKPSLFLIKHLGYPNNCLRLQILKIENINTVLNKYNRHDLLGFAIDYFKSGVFLLIAFLHLCLFLADKRNLHNLIFCILSFFLAILFSIGTYTFYPTNIKLRNQISIILSILIPITACLHCYALYQTFSIKKDIYFKSIIILSIISILFLFIFYDFGWAFGTVLIVFLKSILILKISWQEYRKGDNAAKMIAFSELVYIICSTLVFLVSERISNYVNSTLLKHSLYNLGVLLPPIAIVYYFAYYFNMNSKSLAKKLVEVQELSQEKQETLLKQNSELQAALLQGQTLERKRVAADLHDNLGSTLSALWLSVDMIDKSKMNEEETAIHKNLRQNLEKAYNDVRLLSHNLLPEELEKQGLSVALQYFIKKINQNSSIKFDLQIDETLGKLDKKIEFELYSICLELVNNIIKHSKATEAIIEISKTENQLKLTVEDNGIGIFENNSDGKGMKNVRARVESLNGVWNLQNIENQGVEAVKAIQEATLNNLLAGDRAVRLMETGSASAANYNLDELMTDLRGSIWSELKSKKVIDIYRRNLQKVFVEKVTSLLTPGMAAVSYIPQGASYGFDTRLVDLKKTDLPSIARAHLEALKGEIKAALPLTTDKMSKYHLQDVLQRIDTALNPNK